MKYASMMVSNRQRGRGLHLSLHNLCIMKCEMLASEEQVKSETAHTV